MHKWWAVSRSPRELGGKSHNLWVLNKVLWGKVTNFLLSSIVLLGLWEQFSHLQLAELGNISDVGGCLNLIQVHEVVDHPELVVVVHGNVEGLHGLGPGSALGDSAVNLELSLHEIVVFGLDLLDNIWGVDVLLEGSPVNGSKVIGSSGSLVVVVKNALELRMLLSGLVGVSGGPESIQPLGGELVV